MKWSYQKVPIESLQGNLSLTLEGLLVSIGVALLHRLYGLENHTSAVIENDIRATDISRKEGCYEYFI